MTVRKNKQTSKGFTACGQFYPMGESESAEDYIEYCKKLLLEIKNFKNEKTRTKTN